jgi:hypothetical protein
MYLQAHSYDHLWKVSKAALSYSKILEIQPYNKELLQKIEELEIIIQQNT